MKVEVMRRVFSALGAMLLIAATASHKVLAETWPSRPMTMIVPFGAGSGVDVLGRVLAAAVAERLGQSIVVENIGGAGGMTGTARVAKAAPDGYTFVLGNVGTHAQNQSLYARPLYDAARDFAPVALVADTPQVLVARADLPVEDLRAFIRYLKQNHAKMQFGSPGAGSAAHLACALFDSAVGVEVTHVPYRGGSLAMQDLIAGRIDYQCPLMALALPHVEDRKIVALALLSRQRSAMRPGLATAREQGLDFEVSSWTALFLPKGTPADIVTRLHDAVDSAIDAPGVRDQLRRIGVEPVPRENRSPDFLQRFVEREIASWATAIKAAGLTPQ